MSRGTLVRPPSDATRGVGSSSAPGSAVGFFRRLSIKRQIALLIGIGFTGEFLLRSLRYWFQFGIGPAYYAVSSLFHLFAFFAVLLAVRNSTRFEGIRTQSAVGMGLLLGGALLGLLANIDVAPDYLFFEAGSPLFRIATQFCILGGMSFIFLAFCNSLIACDVTSEQAEDSAAELEANLLFWDSEKDESPAGYLRVDAETGRVRLLSRMARKVFGFDPDSDADRTLDEFRKTIQVRDVEGSLLPFDKTPIGKALESGRVTIGEEYELTLPGGERKWVNGYASPLHRSDGRVSGALAIFRDCTLRRREALEVQKSEKRLRGFFDLDLVGMAVVGVDGCWLEANRALCRLLGLPQEGVIGEPWSESAHPDDLEAISRSFEEVLEGERDGFSLDARFLRPDGAVVQTSVSAKCLRTDRGEVDHFVVLVEDVTRRKESERLLAEQEALYRKSIEVALGVPYRQRRRRSDWACLETVAGESFRDLTGYDPEEFDEIWDRIRLQTIMLGEFAGMTEDEALEVCKQKPVPWTADYQIRTKGGEIRWLFNTASNSWDPDRDDFLSIGILLDVTDRRAEEERIAAQKERLQAVVDAYPDQILLIDPTGVVVDYFSSAYDPRRFPGNPASSPERLVGLSLSDAVASMEFSVELEEGIRRCLEGKTPVEIPYRVDSDGESFFYETGFSRCGADRILAVIRDVTQAKREEEEKRLYEEKSLHSQKLESLGVLAGGIAHDFNNLLLSIMGNSDLAAMESPPDSPLREYLEQIEAAARRASDLTRQMLAYSGRGKFFTGNLDVNAALVEMVELLKVSISKRVRIEFQLTESLPPVHGDSSQIQQIVMNLVTNASDAIGERTGTIWVRSGRARFREGRWSENFLPESVSPEDLVFFEVEDDGCGMSNETLRRLFEPFFTTKFAGRGLGMAAVLGILRGHGGAFEIESEEGKGTRIRALFPDSQVPSAQADRVSRPTPASGREMRVLAIDDEPSILRLIKKILAANGCPCESAESGEKGIEILKNRPGDFDIALVDMTMPGMSGKETIAELRTIAPELRLVLTSGFSEEDLLENFAFDGLNGYIQKPYHPTELLDCLKKAMAH